MPKSRLEDTTIRDFSGGWNVADSDMNLSSRFQPISENVVRGIDGSLYPRWGTKFIKDFADGVETSYAAATYTMDVTDTSPVITITKTAHGFSSGDHVTISGATDFGGIPASAINGTHGILKFSDDKFKIAVRFVATETLNDTMDNVTIVHDTHTLTGNIIEGRYFNNRSVLFTDIGEVGTLDENGNVSRIWSYELADKLATGLIPCRECSHWSADSFKSTLIACNGYDKDKPIQIAEDFTVEFLVDKATQSNSAVPKADYVMCMQGFVAFIRTEYGDPFIEFSAKGTDGTFTRETDPADAVEVDLSTVTSTVKTTLLGASRLRDKMYVAFFDRGMIGQLGDYSDANAHQPDFSDTIAEHGTIGHRTLVSLGNDIFMCDYAGVPSVSISAASGVYIPSRLSELIAPEISKHLSRLSEEQLSKKAFAFFNRSAKMYMLFLPKYNEVVQTLGNDPFTLTKSLNTLNHAILIAKDHNLISRSYITIAGAVDIGDLSASDINGVRKVVEILDQNTLIVELGASPTTDPPYAPPEGGPPTPTGGGNSVTITPVNDETVVYAFEYNKAFRIRRWTRMRGWNFDCGYVSQQAVVHLCKGTKVFQMGSDENPIYADNLDEYDYKWATSTSYEVGDRVLDEDENLVYECHLKFSGSNDTTFAIQRSKFSSHWELYEGDAIDWEVETPWSDLGTNKTKINKYIAVSSEGVDEFYVSAFVNEIRYNAETYTLTPIREQKMMAGDSGGFGMPYPGTWGGGRRTRENKLWPFDLRGKYMRWRFRGQTKRRIKITDLTMYYRIGKYK